MGLTEAINKYYVRTALACLPTCQSLLACWLTQAWRRHLGRPLWTMPSSWWLASSRPPSFQYGQVKQDVQALCRLSCSPVKCSSSSCLPSQAQSSTHPSKTCIHS